MADFIGDVVHNIGGGAQNITHTVNDVAQNIISALGCDGNDTAGKQWSEPAPFATLESPHPGRRGFVVAAATAVIPRRTLGPLVGHG